MNQEELNAQGRYNALVVEFTENGFTEEQADYLINLLQQFIPLI